MFQCQLNPCFPGVPCVNTAPGFRCGKCPLGYTGPEITGVGVAYAQTYKQVKTDILHRCVHLNMKVCFHPVVTFAIPRCART